MLRRLPIPLTPAEALRVVREQPQSTTERVFFISSVPLERLHGTPWKLYGSAGAALAINPGACVHTATLTELIAHWHTHVTKSRYRCSGAPGLFKSVDAMIAAGINVDSAFIWRVWV